MVVATLRPSMKLERWKTTMSPTRMHSHKKVRRVLCGRACVCHTEVILTPLSSARSLRRRVFRMGVFHYDDRTFDFEDRLLTHVQIVVGLKLGRSECFFLSWLPGRDAGSGRFAVWITAGVAMCFEFSGSRTPALNRDWVERMMLSASSRQGLNLSDVLNREPATLR